jgi:hypothetical protein
MILSSVEVNDSLGQNFGMNTKTSDKEKHKFEHFCQMYSVPNGKIIYDDKPDVIINGERKIGIGITDFYIEDGSDISSEQRQSKIRNEVIASAHKQYLDSGGRKIELSFGFNTQHPITNKNKLAENIASLGKQIEQLKTGTVYQSYHKDIPELHSVYINQNEYTDPTWRLNQGHSGQFVSAEKLNKIIQDKENKAKEYQPCDAYWLLIVMDFMDATQDQEVAAAYLPQANHSKFEKILLFKTNHFVHEIK